MAVGKPGPLHVVGPQPPVNTATFQKALLQIQIHDFGTVNIALETILTAIEEKPDRCADIQRDKAAMRRLGFLLQPKNIRLNTLVLNIIDTIARSQNGPKYIVNCPEMMGNLSKHENFSAYSETRLVPRIFWRLSSNPDSCEAILLHPTTRTMVCDIITDQTPARYHQCLGDILDTLTNICQTQEGCKQVLEDPALMKTVLSIGSFAEPLSSWNLPILVELSKVPNGCEQICRHSKTVALDGSVKTHLLDVNYMFGPRPIADPVVLAAHEAIRGPRKINPDFFALYVRLSETKEGRDYLALHEIQVDSIMRGVMTLDAGKYAKLRAQTIAHVSRAH